MEQTVDALNKGSILIDFFRLEKFNGTTLDLIPFTLELNIYESIFEPCISATALLNDSAGIVETENISGMIVSIRYKSFVELDFVTMKFVVDTVTTITPTKDNKGQTYTINMFSVESKRASAIRVNEIYSKITPEVMITDILTNKIKTNKKIYISKTGSIDSINCSSLYPFQAIDAIKKRAVSRKYNSSTYMFFENQYGYNFKPLEEILSTAAKDPRLETGDLIFSYDPVEPNQVQKSAWRKIEKLQKIKQQCLTDQITQGGLRSRIFAYDLNTGQHYKFEYDDDVDNTKFSGLQLAKRKKYSKVSSKDIYQKGDELNNLIVAPIANEQDLLRIQKEIYSKAFANKLMSNIIRMEISGDSRLTVGTAAKLKIPKLSGFTDITENEISSGVYLFSKIRHSIFPAEAASHMAYRQYCEMMNTGVI